MTEKNTYALIRVSTKKQNEARQVIAMESLGIPKANIVIEKESGKSTVRKKYHSLVKKLNAGDTLYIENIDRLSRDYEGIKKEWQALTQKGIILKILDTPILNTDQTEDDLLNRFMRDMFLLVFAYQADSNWQNIKSRQAGGIAAAKARGKKFGRTKADRTKEEIEIVNRYFDHEIALSSALAMLNIKKSAFYNLCKEVNEIQKTSSE